MINKFNLKIIGWSTRSLCVPRNNGKGSNVETLCPRIIGSRLFLRWRVYADDPPSVALTGDRKRPRPKLKVIPRSVPQDGPRPQRLPTPLC